MGRKKATSIGKKQNELLSVMYVTNLHQLLTKIRTISGNWETVESFDGIEEKIKGLMIDIKGFIMFAFDKFTVLYSNKERE